MCLLITQSKDTNFTDEHLADFYNRNRDGIGVMWAEDGKLCYQKIIPANEKEAVDFYNKYARGKDCAVHYRMRTHGDIDMENCHPYEVFGFDENSTDPMPMLLMHNGVLHTGNAKDTTKSDTWHYIRNYLHKLLANDPSLAFTKEFNEIIGKHIGQNRFVLMNHLGQIATINKYQGVEFRGAWLSNEYAWSASKYLPPKTYYYPPATAGRWDAVQKKFIYDEVPTAKKSQVAKIGKRHRKSMNDGGKTLGTVSTVTQTEKNTLNGVSVDCKFLDDVLEMRTLLDAFYVDNGTSNKQLECMIEEMGVSKAYMALELLGDGFLSEKMWDIVSTNRTEMKWFKDTKMSDWTTYGLDSTAKELMQ